ncbi:hypothetical protein GCM10010145_19160 [Streptomyces ruber]|uniref:Uncharacterized protein n=2 Tax=Streptomyces TaxID=1883 RepID=A0A918BA19_9ACTN|nr:hypothetical protein GCM10010145_19160 [Streptomyces ruber]
MREETEGLPETDRTVAMVLVLFWEGAARRALGRVRAVRRSAKGTANPWR